MTEEKGRSHPFKSTNHEEAYIHYKLGESSRWSHVTLFLRKEDDGIWYGKAAMCVRGDQFSRKVGRQVARRKYFDDRNTAARVFGRENIAKLSFPFGTEKPTYEQAAKPVRVVAYGNV